MKRILIPLVASVTLTACTTSAISRFPTISVIQLKTAVDSGTSLLDICTPAELAEGHLASTSLSKLGSGHERLDRRRLSGRALTQPLLMETP